MDLDNLLVGTNSQTFLVKPSLLSRFCFLQLTINDDCVENGEKYRRRRESIERKFHMLVGRNISRDDAIATVPTMGGAIQMERSRK
jgi:hypothetical protein